MAMYIEQLYTGCLAQAAYYLESGGEAAIIDPMRDAKPYLDLAASRGAKIKYIFETHFHADFVSAHADLAASTGAQVVYGPGAEAGYVIYNAKDGERFQIGDSELELLHTPGHTLESSCYLLHSPEGKALALFTGDTLFNGDVGRPDLSQPSSGITSSDLASMLYDSLKKKIMPLPDDVILYPGHGAGSACGKHMSKETVSTIGHQKRHNYAMQVQTREQFITAVLDGLTAPPAYFFHAAKVNQMGVEAIDSVIARNSAALDATAFDKLVQAGATILDTRTPDDFAKGFVPGSLNIGLNGQFAVWVGTLLEPEQQLVLVTEPGKEEESVLRLARVGYENVAGVLAGGVATWQDAHGNLENLENLQPELLGLWKDQPNTTVLDVRNYSEYSVGVVKDAQFLPLPELETGMGGLDKDRTYLIHCAGGYRSMIAASMLRKEGFKNVVNVAGGFGKIKELAPEVVGAPELV